MIGSGLFGQDPQHGGSLSFLSWSIRLSPICLMLDVLSQNKQGRIVHRSGLHNENNKYLNKKYKKSKIKHSYLTVQMVKTVIPS